MSNSDSAAPDLASGDIDTNLGARLRKARESMDLSIDEVSAELRITVEALTALEESRFHDIGAQVFAKGYFKQYAARLGLRVNELAAEFDRAAGLECVVVEPSKTIRMGGDRRMLVWVLAALSLVIIAVLLWFGWQLWPVPELELDEEAAEVTTTGGVAGSAEVNPADRTQAASFETAPVVPVETETQTEPETEAGIEAVASTDLAEEFPAPRLEESALLAAPAAEVAAASDASQTIEPLSADASQTVEPLGADAIMPAAAEVTAASDEPVLAVSFVEDSWAEITAESGERLFFDLGEAGMEVSFPADGDIEFLFGNGGGVSLTLAGQDLQIPRSLFSGDVASFSLNQLTD